MFLTARIEKAIERATVLHDGQHRKGSGAPYIVHPYGVAFLLAHFSDDEDVIIAGLLHDVLEDVPGYTRDLLREEFGERVLAIVSEVTEDFTEAEKENQSLRRTGWKERKESYLRNLANDSPEALMVAAADKIHNLRSLLDGAAREGDGFWKKFQGTRDGLLWFYGEAARIIGERLKHPLAEELSRVYSVVDEEFKKLAA